MSTDDDLFYPSTYHYIKDSFCHVKRCKYGGNCETCPARELRCYAARDTDMIDRLRRRLEKRDREVAALKSDVRDKEDTIASLRCTIDAKTSIIATLQGEKKLPL